MTEFADDMGMMGHWMLRAWDENGVLVSEQAWDNIVVKEGLNYLLSAGLGGGSQTGTWYLGLTNGGPGTAAGDTLSGHSNWQEVSAYKNDRKEWNSGSASGQSIDNTGNEATFSINANGTTIGGAFLCSAKTGNSGILYAVGAFDGGDLTLNDGSTLEVTATFTTSAK